MADLTPAQKEAALKAGHAIAESNQPAKPFTFDIYREARAAVAHNGGGRNPNSTLTPGEIKNGSTLSPAELQSYNQLLGDFNALDRDWKLSTPKQRNEFVAKLGHADEKVLARLAYHAMYDQKPALLANVLVNGFHGRPVEFITNGEGKVQSLYGDKGLLTTGMDGGGNGVNIPGWSKNGIDDLKSKIGDLQAEQQRQVRPGVVRQH